MAENPSPEEKANRAINKGDAASQGPCYVCQKMLWMSFFFDAPKYDAIEDSNNPERLTNVGKLFAAHAITNKTLGIYTIYLNGLQKPLNTQIHTLIKTGADVAKATAKDVAGDKIKDAGKEAVIGTVRSRRLQMDSFQKLKNPKNWKNLPAQVAVDILLEDSPIRDNSIVSGIVGTGVRTRINSAIDEFKTIVKEQTQEITRIRIAIFGADMGGAIARAFANELINENLKIVDDKLFYDHAEVEFMFMGLFDCVSARGKNWVNGFIFSSLSLGLYSEGIDAPMGIRPHFKRVYHAVAAHENRMYKRIDSVRACKAPLVQEELFPGDQGDVIGGHLPGAQGRSNHLSRMPLRRMYFAAMGQGVPLRSLETLEKTDLQLTQSFIFTDNLIEDGVPQSTLSRIISRMLPSLKAASLEEGLLAAASQRLHWLVTVYADPEKQRKYANIYDRLNEQALGIKTAFRLANRMQANTLVPTNAGTTALRINLAVESKLWEFLEKDLENYYGASASQKRSSADVTNEALFEQFIHDTFAQMKSDGVDKLENSLLVRTPYWGYLTCRSIDESDTYESIWSKIKKIF